VRLYHDARSSAKSGLQSDLHIPDHADLAGNYLGNYLPYRIGYFFAAGASRSNAGTLKLSRIDFRAGTRLTYGLLQRFPRSCFAHARDVTGARNGRSQYGRGIANHTSRLAAAAVETKIIWHPVFLSQRVLPVWPPQF
jgi:hypothetical protein